MNRFLVSTLFLTAAAVSATAQVYDRGNYGRDPYANNGRARDPYAQNGRSAVSLVQRVQSDLGRTAAGPYMGNRERGQVRSAQQALNKFQDRMYEGRFDKGKLDSAIDSLNRLVRSDRLHPQDRRLLGNHMTALVQLRSNSRTGSFGGGYGQNSGWDR